MNTGEEDLVILLIRSLARPPEKTVTEILRQKNKPNPGMGVRSRDNHN